MNDKVIFEVICPPLNWDKEKKQEFIEKICVLLKRNNLNYINLPQIVDENRSGNRIFKFKPKEENYVFAKELLSYSLNHFQHKIDPIINIVVPRIPKEEFIEFFKMLYEMGYRNFIFVGKDNSNTEYPGLEVHQASYLIKEKYDDVKIGGIVIFHRENEIKRIINKINHGMDFFVSQIIYDTQDFENFINMPMDIKTTIYISVAPISSQKEIDFLKWLGVKFNYHPVNNPQQYFENQIKQVINKIIEENFNCILKGRNLYFGINVEHITYNNIKLSEEIIKLANLRIENLKILSKKLLLKRGE